MIGELLADPAGADAEPHPAPTEHVQGHHPTGQIQHVVLERYAYAGGQAQR
jgi:hypothetical protein